MWEVCPGAVGIKDAQLDVRVSTAQKTKLRVTNKKPDCAVVVDTCMGCMSKLCF